MQAVLFDLDGTLLDIDIDAFMARYLDALGTYTDSLYPDDGVMPAMYEAIATMMGDHPRSTNEDVFLEEMLRRTGLDFRKDWAVFERFYDERFDALRHGARAGVGAHEAHGIARGLGLKTVVATNPMFPRIAVEKRMAWAGFAPSMFDLVTTWESMTACKPHPAYYLGIAGILGVSPHECLMVGDDARLDLPAGRIGMTTFYVGAGPGHGADHSGTLEVLAEMLPRLAGD